MKAAAAGLALLLLAFAGEAAAHNRGTSYSEWTLSADGAQVRARVSALELTRLQLVPGMPDYEAQVARVLADNLQLWSRAGLCEARSPSAQSGEDGWIAARWTVRCTGGPGVAIRSTLFQSVAPAHLHFARVQRPGEPPVERVLTYAEPAFELAAPPDLSGSFVRYVRLGIAHILSGWDHMAFVVALILLARRLRDVAFVATGFTVAHSITLGAAVLGLVSVRSDAIEALIGFSIALVAAENLWLRGGRERWMPWALATVLAALGAAGVTRLPASVFAGLALVTACYFALVRDAARPLRLRIAIAFIFGLVHGFGFAGALTPLRLPADRLAAGLIGFNGGVELGQLLVIGAIWPLLKLLERWPRARLLAGDAASAAICALGTFWFVIRLFGTGIPT